MCNADSARFDTVTLIDANMRLTCENVFTAHHRAPSCTAFRTRS